MFCKGQTVEVSLGFWHCPSLFTGLEMYFLVHQTFNSSKFHPRTPKVEQESGESGIDDLRGWGRRGVTPDSSWWDWQGLVPVYGRMGSQDDPGSSGDLFRRSLRLGAVDWLLICSSWTKNVCYHLLLPNVEFTFKKWQNSESGNQWLV